MTGRNRLFALAALMALISSAVIIVTISVLYDYALEQQKARLADTVRSLASLMVVIARCHDSAFTSQLVETNSACISHTALINHLRDARKNFAGLGATGEFTLARREGDQIVFLLDPRYDSHNHRRSVPFFSQLAEPMRRALKGESGTIIGPDYRGEEVVAAFEVMPALGLGLVAKIDLVEIRSPFIRAGIISAALATLLILMGVILFFRIGNPMVRSLSEKDTRLNNLIGSIPGVVYQFVLHKSGDISMPYVNEAIEKYVDIKAELFMKNTVRIYDYIHPDDRAAFLDSINRSAKSMTCWEYDFRVMTPSRGMVWVRGCSNPRPLPDGSILWNGVLIDITERKRVGALLQVQRDLGLKLSSVAALDEVLRLCVETAISVSQMDCGGIYLVDEASGDLDLAFHKGLSPEFISSVSHYDADMPSTRLIMAGQPVYKRYTELNLPMDDIRRKEGLRAIAIVPMQYEGRVIACLNISSHAQDEIPDSTRIVIETIANQIGSAISRAKAIEALRTSEAQLSNAMNIAKLGYWEYDAAEDLFTFNDHFYAIFRTSAEKVGGYKMTPARYAQLFLHPDDINIVADETRKAIETTDPGFSRQLEHRIIYADGEIGYISVRYFVSKDDRGRTIKTYGANQDITERKRAEEEVRKSAEALQKAQRIAHVGSWTWNIKENRLEWSEEMYRIFGIEREKFTGDLAEVIATAIHPDDQAAVERANASVIQNKRPMPLEYRVIWPDGTVRVVWAEAGELVEDSAGNPLLLTGIVQDITERKRAEEALRESEEKFRRIAERAFDVIFVCKIDGTILYVSPSMERVFGYAPDEIIGKTVMALAPADEIDSLTGVFKETVSGKSIEKREFRLVKKNGMPANIEVDAVPIYKDGAVIGGQAIIRDVTETRRLQQLESRAQRLETAGQIAGQVAHDLNNLLGPLMAYPELIREDLPPNHAALWYLEAMEQAAGRIADINQDLLTMGRRGHYNQTMLDLNAIVRRAVMELGRLPETLVCDLDLSENLMGIVGGDAQLYRAIGNLLRNAQDATQNVGQITVRTENFYVDEAAVAYGHVPQGEYVRLTIADTGCGIPDDIIQKIFDPFFTTKQSDKKRGSGLGLCVVDAVIRDHGGYLDLATKPGEGTSFYLYFPAGRENPEHIGTMRPAGGNERILIVDDDEMQRAVYGQLLTRLGYRVTVVDSGQSAVELLREHPQDLLILDMIMPPGIDGTETYRRILEINPKQKALIVSGFSETEKVIEAQKLGIGAYVRKPLTLKVLAAAVRTELAKEAVTSSI